MDSPIDPSNNTGPHSFGVLAGGEYQGIYDAQEAFLLSLMYNVYYTHSVFPCEGRRLIFWTYGVLVRVNVEEVSIIYCIVGSTVGSYSDQDSYPFNVETEKLVILFLSRFLRPWLCGSGIFI